MPVGIPAASNREPYRTSPVERRSGSSFGRDYGKDNMPYVVDGKCVYKKKSDGSRGEKVGCTDGSVKDYLAALHANVDESQEKEVQQESKKMKIKSSRLKQIIQEEVSSFIAQEEDPMGEPPADFAGEPDYEGDMARSQLLHLSKYSTELMNMMDDSTQLPAWVQSKITKAADYLGAVKHYIEGQTEIAEGNKSEKKIKVEGKTYKVNK